MASSPKAAMRAAIYTDAALFIKHQGKAKGTYGKPSGPMCMLGALSYAAGYGTTGIAEVLQDDPDFLAPALVVVSDRDGLEHGDIQVVAEFSDGHSKRKVVKALRRAAEIAPTLPPRDERLALRFIQDLRNR